jgi:hypothetical protein
LGLAFGAVCQVSALRKSVDCCHEIAYRELEPFVRHLGGVAAVKARQ